MQIPKNEKVWMSYFNEEQKSRYVITSKEFDRTLYFLYKFENNTYIKISKNKDPTKFEKIIKGGVD